MNYRLLSVAEAELAETAQWYESQAPNLGEEFLDEFEAVMDRVMRFPHTWMRVSERHRRCLFRRFPYAVLYSHTEDGNHRRWRNRSPKGPTACRRSEKEDVTAMGLAQNWR